MDTEKIITEAVHVNIAKEVLASLSGPEREAILVKAVTSAITGYDFKRAVEKVVAQKAEEVGLKMLELEYWQDKIRNKVVEGFEILVNQIPIAAALAIKEALVGVAASNSYDRKPGVMEKHLRIPS